MLLIYIFLMSRHYLNIFISGFFMAKVVELQNFTVNFNRMRIEWRKNVRFVLHSFAASNINDNWVGDETQVSVARMHFSLLGQGEIRRQGNNWTGGYTEIGAQLSREKYRDRGTTCLSPFCVSLICFALFHGLPSDTFL